MNFTHSQFQYAGFLRRALAFCVDTLLISLICSALAVSIIGSEYLQLTQQTTFASLLDWRIVVFEHLLPALWIIGFWMLYKASPGKLLLDCQIVDTQTKGRATHGQLIIRYLAYLVSAIPLGLGFIWIIFDKNRQGWHDKLARTQVIMQDDSLYFMEADG